MSVAEFTPDQLAAVNVEQRHLDACVVAGPGSGKTTVLVEYFRRLVEAGVDPLSILAITFTEKAAANMRRKLATEFQDDPDVRAKLERAWVSTVHGFCARMLRENAVFAGVDPEFGVADDRDATRLQKEAIAAAMEEAFANDHAGVRALIRGLSSIDFEEAVLSAYDAMRGAGMRLDEVAKMRAPHSNARQEFERLLGILRGDPLSNWSHMQKVHAGETMEGAERILSAQHPRAALEAIEQFSPKLNSCKRNTPAYEVVRQLRDCSEVLRYVFITELYAPQRALLFDILRTFERLYRDRKRHAGLLDFSDLEEYAVRLLDENPDARARLQAQFEHVLMDEFQDTNGQQARLLELIRRPDRFYAVGDINQSIFGFRHAEPQGFADYRDAVIRGGRRLVNLAANFRSRPDILSAIETITAGLAGIEPRKLTAGRVFEEARPVSVEAISVAVEPIRNAEAIEARWVARRILDMVRDEGFRFKDAAVLVRNTEVLGAYAEAFDEAGIPVLVNRARGFYDNREVADLTHLLRVIANPRDELSLAAVLRSQLVEVSDEALLQLRLWSDNIGGALGRVGPETAASFTPDDFLKLIRFRGQLHQWRLMRESVSFDRLLTSAMDDCGYRPEAGPRGEANVAKFLAQARDASSKMTLDAFVEELAQLRKNNPRERDAPFDETADAVKVMTVHAAKGLEFPIVFVSAIHKGVDTDLQVVEFSPRLGLGARWRNPARRGDKDDLFQHAIREERKAREQRESERLLYVAMTRAEQHLALTFSGPKPKEWSAVLCGALGLSTDAPCDETLSFAAPDGAEWKLKFLVTDRAPELLINSRAAEAQADVEVLDRPAAVDGRDSNATVTALAQFARCPREYFLGTYLGLDGRRRSSLNDEPCDTEIELPANEFGSQVHALLAGSNVENADPAAVRLTDVFHKSALGRRAAGATRVEREFDFLMSVDDLVLRGQVDLWFEEGGELVIVDYKTDDVNGIQAHQRAADYALQLRLYALAVERVTGRAPNRAWLHFLRPNKEVEVDLQPSLLESPERLVREFQEAQSRLEFPLNEGEHCRRCQFFRAQCPSRFGEGRPNLSGGRAPSASASPGSQTDLVADSSKY